MPSKLDLDALFSMPPEGEDSFQREERCRKALKTVERAIVMRLVVTALLILAACKANLNAAVILLFALVMGINLVGAMPLIKEWKARKAELENILNEE